MEAYLTTIALAGIFALGIVMLVVGVAAMIEGNRK